MKTRCHFGFIFFLVFALSACRQETKCLEEAQKHFNEGVELRAACQTEAAANAFGKALIAIDLCKTEQNEAKRLKTQIEDNLGATYWLHGLFNEALPLLADAVSLSRELNDSTILLAALRDQGRAAANVGQIEEATTLYDEALQITKRLDDNAFAALILTETARDIYLPSEDYAKAIAASTEALVASERPDICHLNLGLAYYYLEQDSLAFHHLGNAIKSDQAGIRMSAYQCLCNLYQFAGDYQKALECHEHFNENMMQAEQDHRAEQVQRIKAEYDLQSQKNTLQTQQKLKNFRLYFILFILVVALIIIALLLRKNMLEEKLKAEKIKNELELELKKNKVYVTALALNEQITTSTIDFELKESEWEDFVKIIDKVYGNFIARLTKQYPNLTKSDIQICCLTKQGFSNQVISILMNLQTNSYARRKSRIKQEKMNGLENERSFEDIVKAI